MTRAFLGLGSNLGDRRAYLRDAVARIPDVVGVSQVYETAPVGGPEQGPFLNIVVQLDTDRTARQLLEVCRDCEAAAERVREVRWGPRTLDVDLITCHDGADEIISRDEGLTLPHPLAHLRAFVLIPWLDVDPDATLTVAGESRPVQRLLSEIDQSERDGVTRTDLVLDIRTETAAG